MRRVNDVDKFYNMIFYDAPNYHRKIMLKGQPPKKFSIKAFCETPDGYKYQIKLSPKTYCTILLVFISA